MIETGENEPKNGTAIVAHMPGTTHARFVLGRRNCSEVTRAQEQEPETEERESDREDEQLPHERIAGQHRRADHTDDGDARADQTKPARAQDLVALERFER